MCAAANINSPGQVVISGSKAAVEHAAELCKHKGAKRAIMLPVSAPFHCSLMQPAQDRLCADLHALTFNAPEIPVMCNFEAALVCDADEIARDTDPAGHRHGAVGKLDARTDCAGRHPVCGSRAGSLS